MGKIKDQGKKISEKGKGFINDFKAFATRGNVIDMAVAVVMGAAFNKIITSLVNDIIMPAIGALMGGVNFSELSVKISKASINYGLFVQAVVDFLIIAFSMFIVIKIFGMLTRKKKAEEEAAPPKKADDIVILEEIRDLLKEKSSDSTAE